MPEDDYTIPFGAADVKRPGDDITLVATSSMVHVALAAAEMLAKEGISAEVIDPRTTVPLDKRTLVDSAKKTGRAIVIDEGYQSYGVTAEIASVIADGAFYYLDAPVKRMGAMDVPIPFSPALEDLTVPTADKVADAGARIVPKGELTMGLKTHGTMARRLGGAHQFRPAAHRATRARQGRARAARTSARCCAST